MQNMTMVELRRICADLGIRPAVTKARTIARIQAAQDAEIDAEKYSDTACPRKRPETVYERRLLSTTALYPHTPYPGPTVRAPRLKDHPTGIGPLRLSGRIQRDIGKTRPPLWAGASTPSGVFDVSRYVRY